MIFARALNAGQLREAGGRLPQSRIGVERVFAAVENYLVGAKSVRGLWIKAP